LLNPPNPFLIKVTPQSPPFSKGGLGGVNYFLCLLFFILALMSKPMAVTLPVVLLILDVYPLERLEFRSSLSSQRRVLIEKLPFLGLSLASSVITVMAAQQKAIVPLEVHPLGERLLIAIRTPIFYLSKMLFPVNLVPIYPYPSKISFLTIEYTGALILLVCITAFCIWSWKRHRIFLTTWAYYIVTLLPVSGIIQVGVQTVADRFTYLPSLGIFILVGLGAAQLIEKSVGRKNGLIFRKLSIIVPIIIILGLLSNLTIMQTRIWKDSITLWNYVLKIFPNDAWVAYYNRGKAFGYLDNYQKAIEDFKKTIKLNPHYAKAYYNIGVICDYHFIDYQQAIKNYSKAIELDPKYAIAYNNRGAVYATLGDYHKAIEDFDITINLDNRDSSAYYNRGLAYKMLGKYNQAVRDFQTAAQFGNKQAQDYLKAKGISW
jgi:Tfp pilus assembly protein PilF